jgi:hypothetical protein
VDKIRIDEIVVSGKQKKSCPFGITLGKPCYISRVNCRYGLTEVRLPKNCPLRLKPVKIGFVSKIVETDF